MSWLKYYFIFICFIIPLLFITGCKNDSTNPVIPPPHVLWTSQSSGTSQNLKAIQFLDSSTAFIDVGIIVGNYGTILRTTDKGISWLQIQSGTNENLYGLHFPNSLTGYICGTSGIILKSTNSGINWQLQHTDSSTILFSIYSIGNDMSSLTYAVGTGGTILKNAYPENIWFKQYNNDSNDLYSVKINFFSLAVGANGTILKSNSYYYDTTWSHINSGTQDNLNSLYFVNSFTGYCTGQNGIIMQSSDHGLTWHSQQSNISNWINSLKFGIDTVCGFGVGDNGIFLKTTNSGTNWTSSQTSTSEFLRDVYFTDEKTGWAVGENGTIIHTTTGGE